TAAVMLLPPRRVPGWSCSRAVRPWRRRSSRGRRGPWWCRRSAGCVGPWRARYRAPPATLRTRPGRRGRTVGGSRGGAATPPRRARAGWGGRRRGDAAAPAGGTGQRWSSRRLLGGRVGLGGGVFALPLLFAVLEEAPGVVGARVVAVLFGLGDQRGVAVADLGALPPAGLAVLVVLDLAVQVRQRVPLQEVDGVLRLVAFGADRGQLGEERGHVVASMTQRVQQRPASRRVGDRNARLLAGRDVLPAGGDLGLAFGCQTVAHSAPPMASKRAARACRSCSASQ